LSVWSVQALFVKRKQQYQEADLKDRDLEALFDLIHSEDDEISILKNIRLETDEAGKPPPPSFLEGLSCWMTSSSTTTTTTEVAYQFELERCQKVRQQTKKLAVKIVQSCKRNIEGKLGWLVSVRVWPQVSQVLLGSSRAIQVYVPP